MNEQEITTGEMIVRTKFNPSTNSEVDEVKQQFAEIINNVIDRRIKMNSELRKTVSLTENVDRDIAKLDEMYRLEAETIRSLEVAAMYYVKLLTV